MKHVHLDQDILLFTHGQLNTVASLRIRLHLATCAECRSRATELGAASAAIASVIRGRSMPPWKPAAMISFPVLQTVIVAFVLAALLVAGLVAGAAHLRHVSVPQPAVSQPCAPGLPSDKCR